MKNTPPLKPCPFCGGEAMSSVETTSGCIGRVMTSELPTTKEEFDSDHRYNGQPEPLCPDCHRLASPRGRAEPMESIGCHCVPGPIRGSLWPSETREEFGYPSALVEEARQLRDVFYPFAGLIKEGLELYEEALSGDAEYGDLMRMVKALSDALEESSK